MSAEGVTRLLVEWSDGDQAAIDRLFPIVYHELRRIARNYFRRERPDHTLQPTALVHEAFLRLIDQRSVTWQNRAHFFALAARMMRRILVNHAVSRRAAKRGGAGEAISLDEEVHSASQPKIDVLALDDALNTLARLDARQTRIVELRFFGGLTVEETAAVVDVSPATVKREWAAARLFLLREMRRP